MIRRSTESSLSVAEQPIKNAAMNDCGMIPNAPSLSPVRSMRSSSAYSVPSSPHSPTTRIRSTTGVSAVISAGSSAAATPSPRQRVRALSASPQKRRPSKSNNNNNIARPLISSSSSSDSGEEGCYSASPIREDNRRAIHAIVSPAPPRRKVVVRVQRQRQHDDSDDNNNSGNSNGEQTSGKGITKTVQTTPIRSCQSGVDYSSPPSNKRRLRRISDSALQVGTSATSGMHSTAKLTEHNNKNDRLRNDEIPRQSTPKIDNKMMTTIRRTGNGLNNSPNRRNSVNKSIGSKVDGGAKNSMLKHYSSTKGADEQNKNADDESHAQALRLLRIILGDKKASSITKEAVDKALKRYLDLLKIVKEQNTLEDAQKKTIAKLQMELERQKNIMKTTMEIKNVELDIRTKERDQKALKLQQLSWKLAKEKTAAKEKAAIVAAATAAANSLTDRAVTAEEAVSAQQVTIQSLERMVEKTVAALRGKDKVLQQLLRTGQQLQEVTPSCENVPFDVQAKQDDSSDDVFQQLQHESMQLSKALGLERNELPASIQEEEKEEEEDDDDDEDDAGSDSTPVTRNDDSATFLNDQSSSPSRQRKPIQPPQQVESLLNFESSASSFGDSRPDLFLSVDSPRSSSSPHRENCTRGRVSSSSRTKIEPPSVSSKWHNDSSSASSSRFQDDDLMADTFLSVDAMLGNVSPVTNNATKSPDYRYNHRDRDSVKLPLHKATPAVQSPEPGKHDKEALMTTTKISELEARLHATQKKLQEAKEEISLLEQEKQATEEDLEETIKERDSKISQLKGVLIACNERRKLAEKRLAEVGHCDESELVEITKKSPLELLDKIVQQEIAARQGSDSNSSNIISNEPASSANSTKLMKQKFDAEIERFQKLRADSEAKRREVSRRFADLEKDFQSTAMIKRKAQAEIERLKKAFADSEAKRKEASGNLTGLERDYQSASAKITELETQLVHARQKLKNAELQSTALEKKYLAQLDKERNNLQQAEKKVEELRLEIAELRNKVSSRDNDEQSRRAGTRNGGDTLSTRLGEIIAAATSSSSKEKTLGFVDEVDDDGLQSHATGLEESYRKIAEIEKNFSDSISLLNRATGHSISLLGDTDEDREYDDDDDDDREIDWLPEGYRLEKSVAISGQESFTETSANGEDSITSARAFIETATEALRSEAQTQSQTQVYLKKMAKLEKKLAEKQLKLNEAELRIATLLREGGVKSLLEDAQESLRQTLREIKHLRDQLSQADAKLSEADGKLMFLKNIVLSVVGNSTSTELADVDPIDC